MSEQLKQFGRVIAAPVLSLGVTACSENAYQPVVHVLTNSFSQRINGLRTGTCHSDGTVQADGAPFSKIVCDSRNDAYLGVQKDEDGTTQYDYRYGVKPGTQPELYPNGSSEQNVFPSVVVVVNADGTCKRVEATGIRTNSKTTGSNRLVCDTDTHNGFGETCLMVSGESERECHPCVVKVAENVDDGYRKTEEVSQEDAGYICTMVKAGALSLEKALNK